jgi:Flavin-binding monooxygenase-like
MSAASSDPICVIGAGGAGLAAVKTLGERNLSVVCYERGSNVGGNWRYENDSGLSAAYASLRCNVSRRRMQYRSLPMPASYGDFPRHTDMAAYFEAYADTFDLRRHIRFAASVERLEPLGHHRWRITLHDGRSAEYGAVVVANGHHWAPQWPQLAGASSTPLMHAHAYRTPEPFAGLRVLVIGAGQSAVEIATELSRVAARTMVSVRGGAYVIPRHLFGRPFDLLDIDLLNRLPWRFLNWLFAALVQVGGDGAIASYGPRGPAHRILEQVPVVSSDLVSALRGGAVVVRPAIDALDGAQVRFVDGAVDAVDAIICATGYRISLPFLSSAVFHADGVAVPLYRRIVAPNLSGLYFIGLVDAPGGLLPIVETQAAWLADVLQGIITLPETPAMWRAIDAAERRSRERFPLEPRHSIRCDPHAYVRLLVRDRRDARRARRRAGAVGRRDRDILRAQPPSSRLLCRSGSGRPR